MPPAVKQQPQAESLISGFLRSLRSYPARPALELGEQHLTYAELWDQAAKIAYSLNSYVDSGVPLTALLANRSITAYSGILGILGSGRGYVPLNAKFPVERTISMLSASACKAVVVGSECLDTAKALLPRIKEPLVWILPDASLAVGRQYLPGQHVIAAENMARMADPNEPHVQKDATAYLLFTSGSTGIPKGVAINHGNVTSYLDYVRRRYVLSADDRCSQNFELTFDPSVHDLFVCWSAGATLCPFPEQYLNPVSLIREKDLTVWFSVPSIAMLASKLGVLEPRAFPSLRLSLFAGEALSARLAEAWAQAAPQSIVENIYGPTEATITISHYRWDPIRSPRECVSGVVPIGWIFEGQQFSIVNDSLTPLPCGETGELCLAGSQVANGYLNDSPRTQQQFVRLPGSEEKRWYRTGDLAKQDERGCVYYLGRIDQQVKISGYRVELQEIEQALREAANTDLAVAVPWPVSDGMASGVVAVIAGLDPARDEDIINLCQQRLPRYMVPTRILRVADLPLNTSGKLDRPKIARLVQSMG
jgi:amino acid adenylation domain-containing protein